MRLHGIFPPLTTPFDADGNLALDHLRANVAKYNRTGLAGYVVVGSTGESVLLSMAEIERVWATVREAAAAGKTLVAGTGVDSTADTIQRTRRAAELGYQVALVKTPHYYKGAMTEAALEAHFLRVADASPIPVLIYSVPQFTGIAVEPGLVARLARHANIMGIKESSGHIERISRIVQTTPPEFQTVVGSAQTLWPSIAVGAVGGVLGLACALPEACVELYEAARAGDASRARTLQQKLLAPAVALVSRYSIAGTKYGMDRMGYYGGAPRPPILPLTEAEKRDVDATLAAFTPAAAARG